MPYHKQKAVVCLFTAVLLWGLLPITIRMADWNTGGVLICRYMAGALGLGLLCWQTGATLREWRTQIPLGISYALINAGWLLSSLYTSVANSLALVYLGAPLCLLVRWVLTGRRPSARGALLVLLGFAGVLVEVAGDLSPAGLLGILFGVLAGACLALHLFLAGLLVERGARDVPGAIRRQVQSGLCAGQVLGFLVLPPVMLIYDFGPRALPETQSAVWLILMIAVWAGSLVFYSAGASAFAGHVTGTVGMSEVLIAGLLAAIFLGEVPPLEALVGGSIILLAAVGVLVDANGRD